MILVWGIYALLSLEGSGRRLLIVSMLAAGVLVHVVTIADSRHRVGLELLFLATAGCRVGPVSARRLWLTALLMAGLVGISAGAAGPGS